MNIELKEIRYALHLVGLVHVNCSQCENVSSDIQTQFAQNFVEMDRVCEGKTVNFVTPLKIRMFHVMIFYPSPRPIKPEGSGDPGEHRQSGGERRRSQQPVASLLPLPGVFHPHPSLPLLP